MIRVRIARKSKILEMELLQRLKRVGLEVVPVDEIGQYVIDLPTLTEDPDGVWRKSAVVQQLLNSKDLVLVKEPKKEA